MSKKSLIILVVAVVIIGGGYLVLSKRNIFTVYYMPQSEQNQNILDTSDWKTYRSEKAKFQIQYPAGWFIDKNTTDEYTSLMSFNPDTKMSKDDMRIFIWAFANKDGLSFDKQIDNYVFHGNYVKPPKLQKEFVMIDGVRAIKGKVTYDNEIQENIYIPRDGYMIVFSNTPPSDKLLSVHNTILQSIKLQ